MHSTAIPRELWLVIASMLPSEARFNFSLASRDANTILWSVTDFSANDYIIVRQAIVHEQVDFIRTLLNSPIVDPTLFSRSEAPNFLTYSLLMSSFDVFWEFWNSGRVSPICDTLSTAIEFNQPEIVAALITRIQPTFEQLSIACLFEMVGVIEALLTCEYDVPESRYRELFEKLDNENYTLGISVLQGDRRFNYPRRVVETSTSLDIALGISSARLENIPKVELEAVCCCRFNQSHKLVEILNSPEYNSSFDPRRFSGLLGFSVVAESRDCVEVLLKDSRLDPNLKPLRYWTGHAGIVRLLLEDGRVQPTQQVLVEMCSTEKYHSVALLLADGRVSLNDEALEAIYRTINEVGPSALNRRLIQLLLRYGVLSREKVDLAAKQ